MKKHLIAIFILILGICFISIWLGYLIGKNPTSIDKQYRQDQFILQQDYNQLYTLCEQKYQFAVRGDLESASRVNGRMDQLEIDIKSINQKYGQ